MRIIKRICVSLLLLTVTACSPFFPGLETPTATLSSLQVLPGNTIVPTFEIGLNISNPNRVPLKLDGMTYVVYLEGEPVLRGLTNQLPVIAAYGEGEVLIQARPDVFSTINLFTRWLNQPGDVFNYSFEAQLDVGRFMPKINIVRSGELFLTQTDR
ncbi:LEA type 2 family protein [Pelovirga terrestris]|uniref:LEA type 2 family protein n=1 Tax=Pelovirga terrestris TaxID=2771352 RepID=A0A8J6ULU0_9BACT|nr:LEA type 2 family protein [Pelovirga terrestris]MBD1401807.1 LEA type 2 family protein [Pelovirga terrestris]